MHAKGVVSLLTHFSIITTTSQYIRVASVDLEPSEADRENLELANFNTINNSLVSTLFNMVSQQLQLSSIDCYTP